MVAKEYRLSQLFNSTCIVYSILSKHYFYALNT